MVRGLEGEAGERGESRVGEDTRDRSGAADGGVHRPLGGFRPNATPSIMIVSTSVMPR